MRRLGFLGGLATLPLVGPLLAKAPEEIEEIGGAFRVGEGWGGGIAEYWRGPGGSVIVRFPMGTSAVRTLADRTAYFTVRAFKAVREMHVTGNHTGNWSTEAIPNWVINGRPVLDLVTNRAVGVIR